MKKLFTLALILFAYSVRADSWTQKANFGGGSRQAATGFVIGNKCYVGTGVDQTYWYLNDLWEYDVTTNVWTQKANLPANSRQLAVAFSIGTKGYVGLGFKMGISYNDFWEWDQATNSWSQKANFPAIERSSSVGFNIGTKGYVVGGWSSTNGLYYKDMWEYNPATNSWTTKADFGGTPRAYIAAFTDGVKAYIGTGTGPPNYPAGTTDFWEWTPATNTWTQKANFIGPAISEACAFYVCPFGYVGLGTTLIGTGTISGFWKYNIANNSWAQVSNFAPGLRELANAYGVGNKGYVGMGWINDNSALTKTDFWEYTPDSACATGIEEFSHSNFEFTIFPNPAKEFIIINFSLKEKAKAILTLIDANGKNIFQTQLSINENQSTISLKDFSKGIYFVEVSDGKQKVVKKFVKE